LNHPGLPQDGDGDGLGDELDACPGTAAEAVVDGEGCSLAQLCPCEAASRHGEHVRCVVRASRNFANDGLLGRGERAALIIAAARGDCGRCSCPRPCGRKDDRSKLQTRRS